MRAAILKRSGLWVAVGLLAVRVGSILANILLTFIFARYSPPVEFGRFAAGFSSARILSAFSTVGQHQIASKYIGKMAATAPGKGRAVVRWSLLRAGAASAVLVALAAAVAAVPWSAERIGPGEVVLLVGIAAVSLGLLDVMMSVLRAQGSIVLALVPHQIGWYVAAIGAFLILSAAGASAPLMLACVAGGAAAMCLVQLWAVAAQGRKGAPAEPLDAADRKELGRTSGYLWAQAIVNLYFQHAPTLLVALAAGPAEAALFFLADKTARLLSLGLAAANAYYAPLLPRAFYADDLPGVQRLMNGVSILAFSVAAAGFAVLAVAGPFILSFAGPGYADALNLILILGVAHLVSTACGANGLALALLGEEKALVAITFSWSLVLTAAVPAGAALFGVAGAAAVAAACVAGWNVTVTLRCSRRLGLAGPVGSAWSSLRAGRGR